MTNTFFSNVWNIQEGADLPFQASPEMTETEIKEAVIVQVEIALDDQRDGEIERRLEGVYPKFGYTTADIFETCNDYEEWLSSEWDTLREEYIEEMTSLIIAERPQKATKPISIKLTEEEREMLNKICDFAGMNMSEFVKTEIRSKAKIYGLGELSPIKGRGRTVKRDRARLETLAERAYGIGHLFKVNAYPRFNLQWIYTVLGSNDRVLGSTIDEAIDFVEGVIAQKEQDADDMRQLIERDNK